MSLSPFTFNEVVLHVVTVDVKEWCRAKEVFRALEYDKKVSKTTNIIRARCNTENISKNYQLSSVLSSCTPSDWPKDSQKYGLHVNKEGLYELMFSSQQPLPRVFANIVTMLCSHILGSS